MILRSWQLYQRYALLLVFSRHTSELSVEPDRLVVVGEQRLRHLVEGFVDVWDELDVVFGQVELRETQVLLVVLLGKRVDLLDDQLRAVKAVVNIQGILDPCELLILQTSMLQVDDVVPF